MSMLAALPFVRLLQQQGGRIYTVGGTVRDELLGRPRKDIDLLVTGLPQETLTRLLRRQGRVQLTGRAFGVIKFSPHGWDELPIDIALPRTEVSTGIGHRDFQVSFDHTLPIETDLARRDFTINALAVDLATNQLIDPFGGRQDLENHLLRQVSDQAFPEDPLRMLRGVQLAARFVLSLEVDTRHAMQVYAASIATVAPERIAEELRKLFQAHSPAAGFVLMQETGLLHHILPEIAVSDDSTEQSAALFARTLRRVDAVQQRQELVHQGHLDLLLTALFQDSQKISGSTVASAEQAHRRLETLRMTMLGANLNRIATLIEACDFILDDLASPAALRHFAAHLGPDTTLMLFDLRLADCLANAVATSNPRACIDVMDLRQRLQHEIAAQTPFSVKELAINGHDLQRLGMPPGPQMGQMLQRLLLRVLDNPDHNTRDALTQFVQQEMQQVF